MAVLFFQEETEVLAKTEEETLDDQLDEYSTSEQVEEDYNAESKSLVTFCCQYKRKHSKYKL